MPNSEEPTKVDLSEVMTLSVIELYILNYLIRIAGSVVRFTVFKDINNEIGKETMSRSSFYNSLDNLARLGYVEIDGGTEKTGRKKSVRALPKAKLAIKQVNIFNIWGSIDPDEKFKELISNRKDLFSPDGRNLIVSFQYPANQQIIQMLEGEQTYLLGDESSIGPAVERYEQVSLDEGYIDKRKDFFDLTVVYRYAYNELRLDIGFTELLEEIIRVTRSGGRIVLLALDHIQGSNNLILESGIGEILEDTLSSQSPQQVEMIIEGMNSEARSKITDFNRETVGDLSIITITL